MKQETKCYCGHTTTCDCGTEQELEILEVPMPIYKETLEEAAKLAFTYEYGGEETFITDRKRDAFIEGAEWQQNRSYSEEEVINLLKALQIEKSINADRINIDRWFKQFKKK
jgi:hypothetical protein